MSDLQRVSILFEAKSQNKVKQEVEEFVPVSFQSRVDSHSLTRSYTAYHG